MAGYESPITLYETVYEDSWKTDFVLNSVKKVGINVDKDKLIRALRFDRDQYNKGYRDAVSKYEDPSEYYYLDESGYIRCSCCKKKVPFSDLDDNDMLTPHCPYSGKRLFEKILNFDDPRIN